MHKAWVTLYTYVSKKNIILDLTLLFIYLFIYFIYLKLTILQRFYMHRKFA